MAGRAAVILCFASGCAASPPRTESPPDPCLRRPNALQGPALSEAQYQEAIARYDLEAIGRHLAAVAIARPADASAQRDFANHLSETGDVEGSILHYRCALSRDPKLTDARVELGAQLINAGEWSEAQGELQRALAETEPNFRIRTLLAAALEGLGQLQAAAEELERAAEETETSAVLYRRAADLYERTGDRVRADALAARADQIDPPPEKRQMRPLREARPPRKRSRPR